MYQPATDTAVSVHIDQGISESRSPGILDIMLKLVIYSEIP